jgi:hypothetical protein
MGEARGRHRRAIEPRQLGVEKQKVRAGVVGEEKQEYTKFVFVFILWL